MFFLYMIRVLILALAATALFAAPVNSKASRRNSSTAGSASSATSRSHKSVRTRSRRAGRAVRTAPAPSYQLHPDPERYAQIQQSLADRGYFNGEVNGQWNDDSIDSLKRFQADQKLDNDGKINALTLTSLGLGPKHDGSTASTVPLSAAVSSSPASGDSPVNSPSPTTPPQLGNPN